MSAQRHIEKEYAEHAAYYDERWARYNHASCSGTLRAVSQCTGHADENETISLLDIACGTGLLLAQLRTLHPRANLFGVDLSQQMLDKAQQRLGTHADLQKAEAAQLPFVDSQFDITICNSASQYFEDVPKFLSEAARVLKPGGQLILTVWASDTLLSTLHYRWLSSRHPAIHKVLKSTAYTELLAAANFELLDIGHYNAGPLWQLATLRARKPTQTDRQGIVPP